MNTLKQIPKHPHPSHNQLIRGMRDRLGADIKLLRQCIQKCVNVAHTYAFEEIQTPLLEHADVFKKSLGSTSDVVHHELFEFQDRGGSDVVLRPEGTAGVVRALLTHKLQFQLPQRWYYYGPMFRHERPQLGRYRQFEQFGVEFLGTDDPMSDVEMLSMAHQCLQVCGLGSHINLEINTLGDSHSREQYRTLLKDYMEKHQSSLSKQSQIRLERGSVLRILDSKDETDKDIIQEAPPLLSSLSKESLDRFQRVQEGLQALDIPFEINPKLVRGLDYYSDTVFEFVSEKLGAQGTVLAGGRYDHLVKQMGGVHVPAVGWAMGLDRVILQMKQNDAMEKSSRPLVLITIQQQPDQTVKSDLVLKKSLSFANELRQQGHSVIHSFISQSRIKRSLPKLLKYHPSHILFLGENELQKDNIQVKDVDSQLQQIIPISDFLNQNKLLFKPSFHAR